MSFSCISIKKSLPLLLLILLSRHVAAQDNYEIQVYTSDIIQKGHTIFELHSNFTQKGTNNIQITYFLLIKSYMNT